MNSMEICNCHRYTPMECPNPVFKGRGTTREEKKNANVDAKIQDQNFQRSGIIGTTNLIAASITHAHGLCRLLNDRKRAICEQGIADQKQSHNRSVAPVIRPMAEMTDKTSFRVDREILKMRGEMISSRKNSREMNCD